VRRRKPSLASRGTNPTWQNALEKILRAARPVILVDSGPLVPAGALNDPHHRGCIELLGSATEELLMPATVSAEVCYMLGTGAGSASGSGVLATIRSGRIRPCRSQPRDSERMAELVEQYADFPLGETAASLIAAAERLGVTKVATLNRRHFSPI
jgi:predicted nucleic acid-binding protein